MLFLFSQYAFSLVIHCGYQGTQFAIECFVVTVQTVSIGVYGFLPFFLHGL